MTSLRQHVLEFGLESLEAFAIKTKRHKKWTNLVLFSYNQLKSPFSNPIVRQSRGIILDENDNWNIVSYPYDKFFNHGESNAATIDWASAVVFEKVDGSLITLYYYEGQWNVATSGTPDAAGPIRSFHGHNTGDRQTTTFAEDFWRIWNSLGYRLPEETDKCFMFEMVSYSNRIVCFYAEEGIYIHGCRDLKTFTEEDPAHYAAKYGWKPVKTVPLTSIDEVLRLVEEINGAKEEGFVIRDAGFRRVKIKSPTYVKLSLLSLGNDVVNQKSLAIVVQKNEGDEFLAYFPHFESIYRKMQILYEKTVTELDEQIEASKGKENRELAASLSKKPGWVSRAVFIIRKEGYRMTARDYLSSCSQSLIEQILRLPKDSES
eukprot:TRINITY_DN6593_c0_g1_i1.p1 TRINITY_DN6593_c0_g1~~TRINITY_DN6593_c0_g1_i1.p1  ORF type:complete len:375 (+),score=62.11 TRINITY_DN6593_c0_g1_i1:223-1347(+)